LGSGDGYALPIDERLTVSETCNYMPQKILDLEL